MKRKVLSVAFLCAGLFLLYSFRTGKPKPRVLVFSKTSGFFHKSIPAGIRAITKLGKENGFVVDTTTDASLFTTARLKKYAAVIFLNTTGDVLDSAQEAAFTTYIQSGKGYVGIHAASDTEFDWPWYGKLVGAYFVNHPKPQEAVLKVTDRTHMSTQHLPLEWKRFDEWYNFKDINPDVQVLINLDETSYTGGTNGSNHPVAWYHAYDGGRAWFTALGHTEESYTEEMFLRHLLGGIRYAIG